MTKRNLDELRIGDDSKNLRSEFDPEIASCLPRTVRGIIRWRTVVSRAAAPVLACFALGLVLFGSQRDTDYDLQLIVAEAAQPGALLPMRALLYENLRGLEGPRLSPRTLELRLRDRSGRVVARTALVPGRAGHADIEGTLRIPAAAQGAFRLHASVRIEGVWVEVERSLRVGLPARAQLEGRPLRALQQFSEGPLQPEPGAIAPELLRVRVGGGACVPEEECRLFVHVGSPAAAVWIEGNSSLTPNPASAQPSPETQGVVALSVVTHGPEAQLWLRASRSGAPVAQRSVRLPVALGSAQLRADASVVRAPGMPQLQLVGGEGGCIIDVYRDGIWLRTGSVPSCSRPFAPPIAPLGAGVYRFQARHDPFGSSTSGVLLLTLLAPAETRSAALRELARRVLELDPSDRFARATLSATEPALPLDAASFGYLAAALEAGVIPLPRAVSGYPATLDRLSTRQTKLRGLSIVALALGALSLALAVGRSGLRAAARADAILLDAGQTDTVRRRARTRSWLSLGLSVLSLLLVFVVVGAYVVARSAP